MEQKRQVRWSFFLDFSNRTKLSFNPHFHISPNFHPRKLSSSITKFIQDSRWSWIMLQVSRACRVSNPHLLFTLDQDTNDQLCRNRKEWPRPIPRNRNRQSIQVHLRDRGASVPQIPQASSGSSWYDLGLRCRRWLNFWGCLFLAYLSQCPFPLQSVPRIKSGLFEEILYFQTFRCVWLEYTGYAFLWIRFLRMDQLWAWCTPTVFQILPLSIGSGMQVGLYLMSLAALQRFITSSQKSQKPCGYTMTRVWMSCKIATK